MLEAKQATKVKRPLDIPHKDFMLMQKALWSDFHRVRIGTWDNDYRKLKEIEWWCNENLYGRWFHSEANEVYYFENEKSAILFKLKWFSEIAQSERN